MVQRISIFVSAACVLLGAAGAHATPTMTTTTQTITFGPGLTDYVNAGQNLNLFDSNLGTLQSVAIGGTYGFNSNLTITNSAANASSGNARTESAAGFSSSNSAINSVLDNTIDSEGSVTVGSTTLNNAAIDAVGTKANYSLAPGASTNSATSSLPTKTLAPVTDTTAADLQAFEAAGGGIFNVLFNTATGTVLSNSGGNTGADEVTTATGGLTITYTYMPVSNPPPPPSVPEPASLALFGTALLGLGMLRRINL